MGAEGTRRDYAHDVPQDRAGTACFESARASRLTIKIGRGHLAEALRESCLGPIAYRLLLVMVAPSSNCGCHENCHENYADDYDDEDDHLNFQGFLGALLNEHCSYGYGEEYQLGRIWTALPPIGELGASMERRRRSQPSGDFPC